jgi:hypothetical protein
MKDNHIDLLKSSCEMYFNNVQLRQYIATLKEAQEKQSDRLRKLEELTNL